MTVKNNWLYLVFSEFLNCNSINKNKPAPGSIRVKMFHMGIRDIYMDRKKIIKVLAKLNEGIYLPRIICITLLISGPANALSSAVFAGMPKSGGTRPQWSAVFAGKP